MRKYMAPLALIFGVPLWSQAAAPRWSLDLHTFTPALEGHFHGISDGNPIQVDLGGDLGLGRDGTRIGAGAEYQGRRFGLEFATDRQEYAGRNQLARDITIDGRVYRASTVVTSTLQTTTSSLNWTLRYLVWPQFWLGLDLGARATVIELRTSGAELISGASVVVDYRTVLPVPQLGPSLGFTALDHRLVGRGLVHLLTYKGATYTRVGADLRYFPLEWLGVRVFADAERFRVPEGSIDKNLDITLDRSGIGFGIVARF